MACIYGNVGGEGDRNVERSLGSRVVGDRTVEMWEARELKMWRGVWCSGDRR
jgi:hypothetical protein